MTTSTMPTRPAPPVGRAPAARPGTARYWIGAALMTVGVIGAALWVALGWLALMHHVDGFTRMAVPGTATVHVNADTKSVFYTEHFRGVADVTAADITVTSPSGQLVLVSPYAYDLRYDVPGDNNRVGRAVASFRSTAAGNYTVSVSGVPAGSTVAIGDDVVWDALPHVIGAVALLVVAGGAGLALVVVTIVQRNRSR